MLAENPLSVLLANRVIDEGQHKAGQLYGVMRHISYGKPFAAIAQYRDLVHENLGVAFDDRLTGDHERLVRATRLYQRADRALRRGGVLVRSETWNVCVASFLPSWFPRFKAGLADDSDMLKLNALCTGLDLLAREFITKRATA
jgi:hypothetical protein